MSAMSRFYHKSEFVRRIVSRVDRFAQPNSAEHRTVFLVVRDEAGQIRRFLNVYVNEEDIRFLGGAAYAFKDGDEVLLVPSIAGGIF